MPVSSNDRDMKELTRAIKDLNTTNTRMVKVCEALNDNLVALARTLQDCGDSGCLYKETHKHGFACDETCKTCKGRTI